MQEKQKPQQRELQADIAVSLDLVELVCDEQGTPRTHAKFIEVRRGLLLLLLFNNSLELISTLAKDAVWSFPVDEDVVHGNLLSNDVDYPDDV